MPNTANANNLKADPPKIFHRIFEPAELIQIIGKPVFAPVAGTSLLWVSNTESDLFRHQATGAFYYLVAGRWFSAPSLDGPWTFTALKLPEDFKRIPPEHPRSRVLASVPGTDQATEAVLLTFAAVAGYTGMMIAWGCAVWGTGWWHPPYVLVRRVLSGVFLVPTNVWLNPYTGTFGRGAAVYGPYGGAGGFAAYNPRTGAYARGGAVYGPYGSRGFAQAWNPRLAAAGFGDRSRAGSFAAAVFVAACMAVVFDGTG